nr:PREDICTED: glutamyl aminopeptidase-like [Linepithema humile]
MAFQKFLLNGALVLIVTITFPTADNTKYVTAVNDNMQDYVIPLDYNVEIQYLLEDNILLGLCSIIINISSPTQSMMLHSVPIIVIDALLIDANNEYTYKLKDHENIKGKNIVALNFYQHLYRATHNALYAPANYTLNMTYMRNIHENKDSFFRYAYLTEEVENQKLIETDVVILKARQLFPCRNDLAIKSTFKIAVQHHKKFTVLSNMPIQAKYKDDSTMIWTDFEKSFLMSAQHIAVVITTFTNRTIAQNTNVTIWCRPRAWQRVDYAKKIMEQIVSYFILKYPMGLSKLDVVVLWHSQDDNVATYGLLFPKKVDIIDETLDHLFRRREIVHMIARQLAFLWSYDVLLWSKEGFASFFGAYILNEIFKDYYMMDLMVIQTQLDSFHYDTPSTTVSEANSLVLPLNNMKSFIIWRMLYHLIPDVFWSGIHQYIDKHTTTPDDLWTTMETIHKAKLPSHEPHLFLKNIIKSWITKKYYSVLNMTRNDENSSIAIDFILSRYLKANEKTKNWIPVTYTTQLSVNYDISDRLFWLTSHSLRRVIPVIDKNDFVLLNIKQTGYYRVNYDERTWYNLIHFLNSENYTKIHVLNRAQLIDDAFYLLLQKQFNYKTFWEFTKSVLRDMNFVTWYPMFKVFESISCRFPLDYGMDAKLQMRTMMLPLLEKIGYLHNQSDNLLIDTVYLREEAVKWACMLNVIDCRKEAAKILSRDLDNDKHSG